MRRRTKINLSILNFLLIGNGILFSQELPSIVTDRPDITESAETVQKNRFQIESGFLYFRNENQSDESKYYDNSTKFDHSSENSKDKKYSNHSDNFLIPNVLFRYGVNDFMELRLGLTLSYTKENNKGDDDKNNLYPDSQSDDRHGNNGSFNFDAPSAGVKFKLGKQNGIVPSTAVILQAVSSILSSESSKDYIDPSIVFCFHNSVSDKFGLGYNFGVNIQNGFNEAAGIFYSLSGSYSFSDKVSVFAEYFGSTNIYYLVPDNGADLGVTYLINNNIQLDLSAGAGLGDIDDEFFIGTGFSIRIPN